MNRSLPYIFVGSSMEGLPIARAVQQELQFDAECQIWSQGVFGLSGGTLESLVKCIDTFDFGVFIITPDDVKVSRGETTPSPRDNVVLELGMFIGGIGRDRTFMVVDQSANVKLPSDLAGVTRAFYHLPTKGTTQAAVGAACSQIRDAIQECGSREYGLAIEKGSFQLKQAEHGLDVLVEITLQNNGRENVPPFTCEIRHGTATRITGFLGLKSAPLLPKQRRSIQWPLFKSGTCVFPTAFLNRLDASDVVFRILMEDSDVVLFQSKKIAQAIWAISQKAAETGNFQAEGILNWMQMWSFLLDNAISGT